MSDEIDIEFESHDGEWSAMCGVVLVFRPTPLEAICALVEYLAS